MLTEEHVRNFFDRYASRMNLALGCDPIDTESLSQAFAEDFIGADPNGVRAGKNNKDFEGAIRAGIIFYRSMGVSSMVIVGNEVQILDELHALVKIHWRCIYQHESRYGEITFVNYYLVQARSPDVVKIFSYVTGDEVKAFRQHGLL